MFCIQANLSSMATSDSSPSSWSTAATNLRALDEEIPREENDLQRYHHTHDRAPTDGVCRKHLSFNTIHHLFDPAPYRHSARANRSTPARAGTPALPPRGKPPVAIPSTRHSTLSTSDVAAAHAYSTPDPGANARRRSTSVMPAAENTPSHELEPEPKASSPPPRARQYLQSAFPQRSRTVHTAAGVGLTLERPEGSSLLIGVVCF